MTRKSLLSEPGRLAQRLCDDLGLVWQSVTPDWSDEPTAWEGVTHSRERVFHVEWSAMYNEPESLFVCVMAYGTGVRIDDCEAQYDEALAHVRRRVREFQAWLRSEVTA